MNILKVFNLRLGKKIMLIATTLELGLDHMQNILASISNFKTSNDWNSSQLQ